MVFIELVLRPWNGVASCFTRREKTVADTFATSFLQVRTWIAVSADVLFVAV